jgi:hypothetical protein
MKSRTNLHQLRSLFAVFLVLFMCVAAIQTAPAHAQGTGKDPNAKICTCVQKAIELLGKYKLPPTALDELLPLLNDQKALGEKLTKMGLSPDEIGKLAQEALPLIKEAGLNPGSVDDFASKGARDALKKAGIPEDKLDEFIALNGDKDAINKFLADNGAKDVEGAAKDLSFFEGLGLDKQAHAHLLARDALNLMEKYGLPPTALGELLPNVNDPAKMAETLGKLGLDEGKIKGILAEAAPLIKEGLDNQVPLQYVQQEAINVLFGKGIPADQYDELLKLRDDAKEFGAALKELGLDAKDVEDLTGTFAEFRGLGLTDELVDEGLKEFAAADDDLDKALDENGDGTPGSDNDPQEPADIHPGDDEGEGGDQGGEGDGSEGGESGEGESGEGGEGGEGSGGGESGGGEGSGEGGTNP